VIIASVSSFISIIASVILIIWERRQYRQLIITEIEKPISRNLSNCIVMLAIADIVGGIGYSLSIINDHTCSLQAQLIEVGQLTATLWTLAISVYHLYQIRCCAESMRVEKVAQGSNQLFLWMCGLCWGIPIVVEAVLLNTHSYGDIPDPYTKRCWLKPNQYLWIFCLYAWLIAVFFGNFIIWFLCHRYLKQITPNASNRPTFHLLLGYTVAFWIVWTFPLVHRIYITASGSNPQVLIVLRYGHSLTAPLQGFFNLIVFGFFFKNYSKDVNFDSEQSVRFFARRERTAPSALSGYL